MHRENAALAAHGIPRDRSAHGRAGSPKCMPRTSAGPRAPLSWARVEPTNPRRMNLHAYTALTGKAYPEYLSINREPDGHISVFVRSPARDGHEGPTAYVGLSVDQFCELAHDLYKHARALGPWKMHELFEADRG